MFTFEENKVDLVFPPGAFISEWLEERNMTAKDLARLCEKTEGEIQSLLDGERLTPEMAITLEGVTKMPAHILIGIQTMFNKYLLKIYREQVGKTKRHDLQPAD